jgi:hypothetical protein
MDQKQRNIRLAKDLCSQAEDLLDDFIRENLDPALEMDDLVEQFDTCREYIRRNVFRETV